MISGGDKMKEKFYCPDCKEELEEVSGCGSVSYFCIKCNCLISRHKILNEEEKNKEEKK